MLHLDSKWRVGEGQVCACVLVARKKKEGKKISDKAQYQQNNF